MTKKIKIGKILLVVFLTILIWVWADLAKTEEYTISGVIISVDKSSDPALWIQIVDASSGASSAVISKVVFEGSLATIGEARRILEKQGGFEFFLNPQDYQVLNEPGEHTLDVLNFLRAKNEIAQFDLTVKSCEPAVLNVTVTRLVDTPLNVECRDESGKPLQALSIIPPQVKIPVPPDWAGPAVINLNPQEVTQAKSSAIEKVPFITLADNQIRNSKETVKVTLVTAQKNLPDATIPASVGFVYGSNIQGQYKAELLNQQDLASVNIQATEEARKAYEQEPFHILLYITDRDVTNLDEEKTKKVVYSFPEQFVRTDDIKLKGEPAVARFRLVPLTAPAAPVSVPK